MFAASTFLPFLLTLATSSPGEGSSDAPATTNDATPSPAIFPNLNSLVKSTGEFTLPSPQADLTPTALLENSPMSFTITNPPLNLAETDLAINSPMSFNITQPRLELDETDLAKSAPMSFTITQPALDLEPTIPDLPTASASAQNYNQSPPQPASTSPPAAEEKAGLPLEPIIYGVAESRRRRRRQTSSSFPSFYSLFRSSGPFLISFPTPDLSPGPQHFAYWSRPGRGASTKLAELLSNEIDQDQLGPIVARPVRQGTRQDHRQPPRYPPFDPFNTTYIPLPGPSSPAFALPLDSEDPFMKPGARNVVFKRPIRHTDYHPTPFRRLSSEGSFESSAVAKYIRDFHPLP